MIQDITSFFTFEDNFTHQNIMSENPFIRENIQGKKIKGYRALLEQAKSAAQ